MSKDNIVESCIPAFEDKPESSARDFSFEKIYGMRPGRDKKAARRQTTKPLKNGSTRGLI